MKAIGKLWREPVEDMSRVTETGEQQDRFTVATPIEVMQFDAVNRDKAGLGGRGFVCCVITPLRAAIDRCGVDDKQNKKKAKGIQHVSASFQPLNSVKGRGSHGAFTLSTLNHQLLSLHP